MFNIGLSNGLDFFLRDIPRDILRDIVSKADIRNPLSLLAHERSRFATCQWELLTPTDIRIPLPTA